MKHIVIMLLMLPNILIAADWDESYIHDLYADRQLDAIEGLWQFPSDGATIAIVKATSSTYDIYLLDSPQLDVQPGTHIGVAVMSPKRNYYDGELKSSKLGKKNKLSSQTVTFTVNDGGTLSIKPYKTGYSVSFKRWLSYLSKLTITDNTQRRPTDLNGAKRIYPEIISDRFPICL